MKRTFFISMLAIALVLNACQPATDKSEQANDKPVNNVSANQHLLMATAWYQESAELDACYYQAFYMAELALDKNLSGDISEKPNAIVLDIDETLLDNSPFQVEMILTGKAYNKEFWKSWTDLARAEALPGAIEFLEKAKARDVEIFYISNRLTNELEATVKNMTELGFPEVREDHFLLKGDTSDKDVRRAIVRENYDILLLIGDNLADYSNFLGDRSDNYGKTALKENKDVLGREFIILPNPMYGNWVKPLKKATGAESEEEFTSKLPGLLKGFE